MRLSVRPSEAADALQSRDQQLSEEHVFVAKPSDEQPSNGLLLAEQISDELLLHQQLLDELFVDEHLLDNSRLVEHSEPSIYLTGRGWSGSY